MTDLFIFILHILCIALALPALLWCGYLWVLTLLSGRMSPPPASSRQLTFDIIIPAHNEEQIIARTLASLQKIDWPADRFRLIVVADNCTDSTAAIARKAGAQVWERHNERLRGKGYALEYAFELSMQAAWASAIVVVDADSEVTSNLLEAFATRLESGAQAVQVDYGVLNPHASWRTRMMTIALTAFHVVRSRGRERLGASCGIRGNGWCITHALLKHVPYHAYSLAEDIEFGVELGLAGYRIVYADEAHVYGEMVSQEQAARNQRRRWEDGRLQLMRIKSLPLLGAALRRRSMVCFDLAMDLLVLPLSYVVMVAALLAILSGLYAWLTASHVLLWIGLGCITSILLYVMRGWQLSGTGLEGLKDLARAPVYLVWKLLLMAQRQKPTGWVRTDREAP